MRVLSIILLFSVASFAHAQTKVIGHKSHSGSKSSFAKVYKSSMQDSKRSNFGDPGDRKIILLDSVIAVNDSVTIFKIRESVVCMPFGTDYRKLKKSQYRAKDVKVLNHKVFNKNTSLKTLKAIRRWNYPVGFYNEEKDVVFIGFKK